MVPQPWLGFFPSLCQGLLRRLRGQPAPYGAQPPAAAWELAAVRRRRALLLAIATAGLLAAGLLGHAQPSTGPMALHLAQVALYTLLFAWVAAGCVTAVMGFMVQWRGDSHRLSAVSVAHRTIPADARTAVIMPICNEQVAAVFAGLRATCESLSASGATRLFDVFVLSDTSDPSLRAAELAAWKQLRDLLGDEGTRVYYRWRQRRSQRKAGNVADFCRRWGRDYRYMVVLDADSVMSGDCLLSLVRLMEAHPRAGILQTAPQACGLSTLHARAQQFAGRVAGRLFAAGMQYWQLGESHYWGHNAIIRVEPFMRHCALAPLPGCLGAAGTEIMSHDFVEAALMRRAGYHVWLVPDLAGSYEQQPPNLLEELRRDRRWCQGNLRNARLIAEPGLHPVHRAMLATGVMAYLSAPLWLAFVLLGAFRWWHDATAGADHAFPMELVGLWACTLAMLALPRVLGVLAIALRRELPQYGGASALVRGALLEGLLSVLQAPVRMIAHSLFVGAALTGLRLEWKSPPREATAVTWAHAVRRFAPLGAGAAALLATLLGGGLPTMAWWFLPVALPLLLATPLAVLTSRTALGERARAYGLLLTPEELGVPTVLRRASVHMRQAMPAPDWRDVLTDPWLFKVVCLAMGPRDTTGGTRGRNRSRLIQRAAGQGVDDISAIERMRLMSEPQSIAHLRARLVGG